MSTFVILFISELVGGLLLILIGNGICLNINMKNTNGYQDSEKGNGGWIGGCIGWGFAVMVAATVSSAIGGVAHFNPAVTMAQIVVGKISGLDILAVLLGGAVGMFIGQILVDLVYFLHIKEASALTILGCHSTIPKNKNIGINFFVEAIATAVLVTVVIATTLWFKVGGAPVSNSTNENNPKLAFMGPIFTGLTVMAIGFGLGGPTGYAINPYRDLIPRIVHQIMPLPGKGKSDWKYAWIPVIAPLVGGAIIGGLFLAIQTGIKVM